MTPRLPASLSLQVLDMLVVRAPHLLKIVYRSSCSQTFSIQGPIEKSFKKKQKSVSHLSHPYFIEIHIEVKWENRKDTVWNSFPTDQHADQETEHQNPFLPSSGL